MADGRILRIYRDGRKHERLLERQLPTGAQANLETLAEMQRIVKADSREPDLRNFVFREIIGLDKKTLPEQIEAAFTFCRDQIIYEPEKAGYETIADLWSCCYALDPEHASGDCAIKCVALATCLSYLNLQSIDFVAIQQIPNADFYNHVYVAATTGGRQIKLDPTPPEFRIGDALPNIRRLHYKIL